LKITESPRHIVLGFGCLAGKDFGQKMSNISLVRKYFQQLPLDFQQSFTSAMQKGNYQSCGVPDVEEKNGAWIVSRPFLVRYATLRVREKLCFTLAVFQEIMWIDLQKRSKMLGPKSWILECLKIRQFMMSCNSLGGGCRSFSINGVPRPTPR